MTRPIVTPPIRVLFFCGERSRYGFSHLRPLLEEDRFSVCGVVLATEERWLHFRQVMSGTPPSANSWVRKVLRSVKRTARKILRRLDATDAAVSLCRRNNVPVYFVDDVNSQQSLDLFMKLKPQLILCAAYPQIFQRPLLDLAPLGAVNSHPSLLPRYRGAHPHFWVLVMGERKTGVSMHYMTDQVDAGDVIVQVPISIENNDTYSSLYGKIVAAIPHLVSKLADFMLNEHAKPIPQDNNNATFFRSDREIHRCILWNVYTAEQIKNIVRACDGRAFFWVGDVKVFVEECTAERTNRNLTNNIEVPPGTVVDVLDGKISVQAKEGVVTLERFRVQGFRKIRFGIGRILM